MSDIPGWMEISLQQDRDEERMEIETPQMMLNIVCRNIIVWLTRKYLNGETNGVAGETFNMLEKYFSKKIEQYLHLSLDSSEWREECTRLCDRMPLLTSVCISLISKMMSSHNQVGHRAIKSFLDEIDEFTSLKSINDAECEVLSTLDFKVPLFTNVQKATMLAKSLGMFGMKLEIVVLVTELAEYYRPILQNDVINVYCTLSHYNGRIQRDAPKIRHVPLVAASIIAAEIFMKSQTVSLDQLALVTKCEPMYIKSLGGLIYCQLNKNCEVPFGPVTPPTRPNILSKRGARKRKLNQYRL